MGKKAISISTLHKRGVKCVHIGGERWTCGKRNTNYQNTNQSHMVVYGPDKKEHHLYDDAVKFVCTDLFESRLKPSGDVSYCDRHGNVAIESNLKIFILTHILDDASNWCFDLAKVPATGKLKVIYDNGTVKNIDFDGEFKRENIKRVSSTYKGTAYSYTKNINPIAYRI